MALPLPLDSGISATVTADTAASESASRVFSCFSSYNEDE